MKINSFVTKGFFMLALLCLVSTSAFAGVNTLTPNGRPLHWPNGGRNIPFNPDLGNLGPMTNAEAVAQTVAAFRQWADIPTTNASYVNTGPLPLDVDETNFLPIVFGFPDDTNPIIYDTNGAILEMIFGASSTGILGDTIQTYDLQSGEILRSVIILNGGALDAGLIDSRSELGVQVHEIGHLSGLAHSHVNGDLGLETTGPYPYDTFPRPTSLDGLIETMYFALIEGGGQETPAVDDRSAFSTLYPAPDFLTNTGSMTGRIRLPDGAPENNVSVLARNIANPFGDAVLAISGSSAQSVNNENAGVYTFNGLTPGAQYAVFIQEPPSSLFRRAEFYNGADESNNVETDHPNEFIPLTAVAGRPLTGIDIILDFPPSGSLPPAALAAGSVEVPLPFPFEIGGQRFDTVFVNWDGNLTFGEPDPHTPFDSPGRAANHLFGPPRIAALWTPLEPLSVGLLPPPLPSSDPPPPPPGAPPPPPPPDPSPTPPPFMLHGVVSLALTDDTFTVSFTDVPTLRPDGSLGGPNTFSIELHARHADQGNRVTLSYGQLDARNGVAGYSCGSSLTSGSEHETDLSTLPRGLISGESWTAIFEEFAGQDFDLDNRTLTFEMPGPFSDQFEPNNSLARARRVSLPFNTADQFADISPGDVDFYRFRANAGETLVAETVPGVPLDTLIGLVGPGGILLASNDDTAGSFSRVLFTVPSDGEYAVAVTTNPDVNFTGAGAGSGRYILTINSYRGRVLPLSGDDVTTEVPLRFAFGFQGREWSSVWVSSNGNLTFGAPEAAQSREDLQLEGFLAGPPRIAPLFTDLDPSGSFNGGITGLVLADQDNNSLTVHWVSVPRVGDIGTNTFSVMLTAAGEIKMSWDAISRDDFVNNGTIVGISKGNGAADPTPTDMSLTMNLSVRGTTYEQFDLPGPDQLPSFDLSFDLLTFLKREGQERDDGP